MVNQVYLKNGRNYSSRLIKIIEKKLIKLISSDYDDVKVSFSTSIPHNYNVVDDGEGEHDYSTITTNFKLSANFGYSSISLHFYLTLNYDGTECEFIACKYSYDEDDDCGQLAMKGKVLKDFVEFDIIPEKQLVNNWCTYIPIMCYDYHKRQNRFKRT
jgi:endonuclease III-like uncharacterized protein